MNFLLLLMFFPKAICYVDVAKSVATLKIVSTAQTFLLVRTPIMVQTNRFTTHILHSGSESAGAEDKNNAPELSNSQIKFDSFKNRSGDPFLSFTSRCAGANTSMNVELQTKYNWNYGNWSDKKL